MASKTVAPINPSVVGKLKAGRKDGMSVVVVVNGPLTVAEKAALDQQAKNAFGAEAGVVVKRGGSVTITSLPGTTALAVKKTAAESSSAKALASLEQFAAKLKVGAKAKGFPATPAAIEDFIDQVRTERRAKAADSE